jgi:hypothetical protein
MRLWTYQSPDYCITSDRLDLARSAYYNQRDLPSIRTAYARLGQHFGTGDLLWCFLSGEGHDLRTPQHVTEWELDVPGVLGVIDGIVWNAIIRSDVWRSELRDALFTAKADDFTSAIIALPVAPSNVVRKREWRVEIYTSSNPPGNPKKQPSLESRLRAAEAQRRR